MKSTQINQINATLSNQWNKISFDRCTCDGEVVNESNIKPRCHNKINDFIEQLSKQVAAM